MKLAAARVFVHNLEEASEFYEHTLGLRVGARGPEADYVVFEAQTCDLIVERVPPDAPQDEQILVGRFTGLSFDVKNITTLCRELASKGVQFTGQPESQSWGEPLPPCATRPGMSFSSSSTPVRPNPSLKRSANGRPPGPGRWYAVHFHRPGPGVLPSSPA